MNRAKVETNRGWAIKVCYKVVSEFSNIPTTLLPLWLNGLTSPWLITFCRFLWNSSTQKCFYVSWTWVVKCSSVNPCSVHVVNWHSVVVSGRLLGDTTRRRRLYDRVRGYWSREQALVITLHWPSLQAASSASSVNLFKLYFLPSLSYNFIVQQILWGFTLIITHICSSYHFKVYHF